MFLSFALVLAAQEPALMPEIQEEAQAYEEPVRDPVTGEFPVDPYIQDNANAGAKPFTGDKMAKAFGGKEGIQKITDHLIAGITTDPRIEGIFRGQDMVRFRRTLFEQFCYILNAGCNYTGRDMQSTHKNLGTQMADLNALVENLQDAMDAEDIPFALQNRFLAKLAPMKNDVVDR